MMKDLSLQKIKLLVLYDILYRYTNEEHPLNTDEIIELLAEKGITVTRKVLREDIKLLNACGYEVMEIKKKFYYYYVESRDFEIAEVKMLTDVVSASKLDAGQKKSIIEKLAKTLGNYRAESILNGVITYNRPKRSNSHIIYSIDTIDRAIKDGKKISFAYFHLDHNKKKLYGHNGEKYKVNPVAMIWDRDNYYLVCYDDEHDDTANYRIDRMENVSEEAEDINRDDRLACFDAESFRSQVFSMFSGERQNVTLKITADTIEDVLDKFGEDVNIKKTDEDYFVDVSIQVSKNFFAWLLGSQGKIKIQSPQKVEQEFYEFFEKIKSAY